MLTTYKIFPIYLGEIPVHDKSSFTYMVDPGVKMTCPFISFLLLGSNGRKSWWTPAPAMPNGVPSIICP